MNEPEPHVRGQSSITFARSLQPLVVSEPEPPSTGVFRTCALIAATPHTPVNRKAFTDRCSSSVIPCPVSNTTFSAGGQCMTTSSPFLSTWPRCSTAPPLCRRALRAASPTFGSRAASAARPAVDASASSLPRILHFEGWWQQGPSTAGGASAQRTNTVSVDFHTNTSPAAFHIRGTLCDHCTSSSRSGSSTGGRKCSSSSINGGTVALAPQGSWLCVTGAAGEPIDHWDLHVGAELNILGRRVVLKKASCATTAWLDAWAKLLIMHKVALERELSKFAPVLPSQGLVARSPARSDWGSPGMPIAPTGGQVNLRHLREDVALLAARLRQHKATVKLPPQLKDLNPEGPDDWSLDSMPQMFYSQPFTPTPPKHTKSGQLLTRQFSRGVASNLKKMPSLGNSPTGSRPNGNLNSLMCWLQSIPLAASAANATSAGSAPHLPHIQC